MTTNRLEAFSDGVLAVAITIMVLELRPPDGATWGALATLAPSFAVYVMSFVYVGIYWSNHHHLFQAAERVNGAVLWANLHLLFWLSLVPFVTAWMGRNHFDGVPAAVYGIVLFMAACAWYLLFRALAAIEPADSPLRAAVRGGAKEIASILLYAVAIGVALYTAASTASNRLVAVPQAIYALVAVLWIIPDRRIERRLTAHPRDA